MSFIRIQRVTKEYRDGNGTVLALDRVNFEIEAGEFVAITGTSGSGKSTLLTVLGGLNSPSSGRVYVDDINVYDLKPEIRADFRHFYIGFLFQSLHLVEYLTAIENIMLPLMIDGIPRRQQRDAAAMMLDRVGLGSKSHRLPGNLSGGEQSRVAIARAIVNRPRIILADEPTGSLDSRTGQEIMELFCELNEEITIAMVTHDAENQKYASRNIRLSDGALIGGSV